MIIWWYVDQQRLKLLTQNQKNDIILFDLESTKIGIAIAEVNTYYIYINIV